MYTQKEKILARLKQGPADAIELNQICFRYGARLCELRKLGIDIRAKRLENGIWEYCLVDKVDRLIEKQEERIEKEKEVIDNEQPTLL